jgi:hypothetical protein
MTEKVLKVIWAADPAPVKRALSELEQSHATYGSKMSQVGSRLQSTAKSVATSMALPLSLLGGMAVTKYAEFAAANAQTEAAIKSTGGAAGLTVGDIQHLSETIGKLTVQDQATVQAAENILLAFPKVRNEVGKGNDIFNQASLAAANLSARMGIALPGAMKLVGKALTDPIKGITALTRVGVQFTDQQKAQLKAMVASGNQMGAQKLILAQLSERFAGSAKAAGDNAPPLQKIKVLFADLSVQVGQILMPIVNILVGGLSTLFGWFQSLPTPVQKMIEVGILIGVVWAKWGKISTGLIGAFKDVQKGFKALMVAFEANPYMLLIAVTILLVVLIVKNWSHIKAFLLEVWHAIVAAAQVVWNLLKAFFVTWFKVFLVVVTGGMILVVKYLADHWVTIKKLFGDAVAWIGRLWSGFWGGLGKAFSVIWGAVIGTIRGGVNALIDILNVVISTVDHVIQLYNDIPFLPNIPLIPQIPHLAAGTDFWQGGAAWVGEHGKELVNLPRGAQVIPNNRLGGVGGVNWSGNVIVQGHVLTDRQLRDLIREELLLLARRNGG